MDFGIRMGLNGKGDCMPFSNLFVIFSDFGGGSKEERKN
jgi:hypothetical protein